MTNIFEQPEDFIPDTPATFTTPPAPLIPPKTMLEQLWEEEPMQFIPGSEPEEEEPYVDEVSHREGLRLLSEDLDEYIKQFHQEQPFIDITQPFFLVGEDGSHYHYRTNEDIFNFNLAVSYCCMRLQFGDEAIPPFHSFYRKLNRLITHSSNYGDELRWINIKVDELVKANHITNIRDLLEAYSELYLVI